jgi:hypothetical protein
MRRHGDSAALFDSFDGWPVQHSPRGVPGKRTLTSHLAASNKAETTQRRSSSRPATPPPAEDPFAMHLIGTVQRAAEGDAGQGGGAALASYGLSGSSTSMPHLERIQAAFGPEHDLSGVRAHVGGVAAEAADGMGAVGYATGNHVAFAEAPDLHLAAHEAAHVVQQRAGVQLKGGVGEVGDVYEHHADQVADAVVRGESIGALLAPFSSRSAAVTAQLQQKVGRREKRAAVPSRDALFDGRPRHATSDDLPDDLEPDERATAEANAVLTDEELEAEHGVNLADSSAFRMSHVLNKASEPITPARARRAGLERRVVEAKGMYFITDAADLLTYVKWTFGTPSVSKVLETPLDFRAIRAYYEEEKKQNDRFERIKASLEGRPFESPPDEAPRSKSEQQAHERQIARGTRQLLAFGEEWSRFYDAHILGRGGIIAFEGGLGPHVDIFDSAIYDESRSQFRFGTLETVPACKVIRVWYAPMS